MGSGGARNRSGPAVSLTSETGLRLTALPSEGYRGRVPKFPLPGPSERELVLWRQVWRTPQACAWASPAESWRQRTVAMYVRTFVRCEAADAPAALIGQLHRFADQIGMTTAGLSEMGWRVAADEVAGARAVKVPPAPTPRRMRAVGDGA